MSTWDKQSRGFPDRMHLDLLFWDAQWPCSLTPWPCLSKDYMSKPLFKACLYIRSNSHHCSQRNHSVRPLHHARDTIESNPEKQNMVIQTWRGTQLHQIKLVLPWVLLLQAPQSTLHHVEEGLWEHSAICVWDTQAECWGSSFPSHIPSCKTGGTQGFSYPGHHGGTSVPPAWGIPQ